MYAPPPRSLSRRTFSKASIQARPVARSEKGLKRKSVTLVKGDVLGEQVLYSQPQPLKRKKSIRPMAGRKNKEGREKAINDLRSREVQNGTPFCSILKVFLLLLFFVRLFVLFCFIYYYCCFV